MAGTGPPDGMHDEPHGDDDGTGAGDRVEDSAVPAVRAFSRFYTRTLRLLDEGLLDTSFSLTEVRVMYELGRPGELDLTALRDLLRLDAGYLSRVLSRLSAAGAVTRERSGADRRRQVVRLTDHGRDLLATFDQRASQQVAELLEGVDASDRRRLTGAMQAVRDILSPTTGPDGDAGASGPAVVLRSAGPGDFGWIVERHGALYAHEYGWDETFEALVARIVADLIDARSRAPRRFEAWIADVDGRRAGCVCCVEQDSATAKLRLLLVEPWARGLGLGTRLVDECIRFARRAGYPRMVLWTNDVLVEARRIYERAGFTLVDEEPHRSFGHDLVGQTWQLDLTT